MDISSLVQAQTDACSPQYEEYQIRDSLYCSRQARFRLRKHPKAAKPNGREADELQRMVPDELESFFAIKSALLPLVCPVYILTLSYR